MVTTKNGKLIPNEKAHKIGNAFYEKNVDVVYVNDKWNRIDNGIVAYDNYKKEWSLKKSLIYGYIGDKKLGYFSKNPYICYVIVGTNKIPALNHLAAITCGFYDDYPSEYYLKNPSRKILMPIKQPKNYHIHGRDLSKKFNYKKNLILRKFLKNYKFGFEFETSSGYIKSNILNEHGVKEVLDGSLRVDGRVSFEYATFPFSGLEGVEKIKSFLRVLNTHCLHNLNCSNHLNLSGIRSSKHSLIRFYNVLERLQDSLFLMFPEHRRDSFYCKKIPPFSEEYAFKSTLEFESYYHDIVKFLSKKEPSIKNNIKIKRHPIRGKKWNIHSRYYWVNLNDFVYSENPRIEFRIHEASFSFKENFYWLLICLKIVKYSLRMTYMDLKSPLSFEEVCGVGYKGSELVNYYKKRVNEYRI